MKVLCLIITAVSATPADRPPIWLAVGRPGLIQAIEPLARHRRGEGFETIISSQPIETALRAAPRRPTFLLLIGDDQPGEQERPWHLPTKLRVLYRWRAAQSDKFAADALWGDVDHDLIPDVAVGRIPARSREEVARVVAKIIAFERREPTPADLRLIIWGGSPAYGPAIDGMATAALLGGLQSTAPRWAEPWVISADPNHALCGWPPDQPQRFAAALASGAVLGILMGHSSSAQFVSMRHENQSVGFSATHARQHFDDGPPAPPIVIFACDAGKFDAEVPCLAETMLLSRGGPVAVIAATTESHPLTNYYSGFAQLAALDRRQNRLGLMWLDVQRRASADRNPLIERLLRNVEGKLEEEINVANLRRDQMLMYAVFGDPATRITLPQPLKATIERTNDGWSWTAERPAGATQLSVGFRHADILIPASAAVQQSDPDAARSAFESANRRFKYVAIAAPLSDGPWRGKVDHPGWLRLVATGPGLIHAAVVVAE